MSWVKEFRVGGRAPATAGKKTVEEWATELGYLPEIFPGKTMQLPQEPGNGPRRVALGAVSAKAAPRYNPNYLTFRQAQLHHSWVIGVELTKEEFLAALKAPHEGPTKVVCR